MFHDESSGAEALINRTSAKSDTYAGKRPRCRALCIRDLKHPCA